jgi:hypothetical protein
MVKVDQRGCGLRKGVLAQVPGGTPSQTIGGDVSHLGHTRKTKVAALRQQGRIEGGKQVGPTRFLATEMAERFGEIGPLIHFDEQVGQVDQGQTCRHSLFEAFDTCGSLFGLQGWHDDPPFLHADLAHAALASHEPIDLGQECVQLAPPLL